MANAVEDVLSRANPEQKVRNQQVIEEARRNIKLVSMQQMDDISPSGGDAIARNAQIIEEAKRNIPFETMRDVDSVSPPLPTPSNRGYVNSTVIELHPNVQSTVENIEQGGGNNYLQENAIDRAMARESQEMQAVEEHQQAMSR
jgi:hypothetical protein